MEVVLDAENADDVVGDVGVGVSVVDVIVGDGGALDGLRFFRCHYRGGVAIIVVVVAVAAAALSSLFLSLFFSSLSRTLSVSA